MILAWARLTEIEHCFNSRTLTYISDNPEYDVITPEGFLITKAAISIEKGLKGSPIPCSVSSTGYYP